MITDVIMLVLDVSSSESYNHENTLLDTYKLQKITHFYFFSHGSIINYVDNFFHLKIKDTLWLL